MSDSHFPEFVDSQSMKTLEVAFYFRSVSERENGILVGKMRVRRSFYE